MATLKFPQMEASAEVSRCFAAMKKEEQKLHQGIFPRSGRIKHPTN
jgi:hypothetical protein